MPACINVTLPYEIAPNHGKDLRDWILEGHTFADLLELASNPNTSQQIVGSDELAAKLENGENGDSADIKPNEALDDPHRLARVNQQRYEVITDGGKIRFWRDEWYCWKHNRYRKIQTKEFEAKVGWSIKQEFDRANIEAQLDYNERLKLGQLADGEERPVAKKVTRSLIINVIQSTASESVIGGNVELNYQLSSRQRRSWIAMQNGIVDVDALLDEQDIDDVLLDHTPDWFSTICLPYAFDPDAECPRWERFLERCMGGDQQLMDVLQEWAGYCLLPDTSHQKFLINEGEGGNGKSVHLAAMEALLGIDNCSHVSLEKFGGRFDLTETIGKLANISGDMGEIDRICEGHLKSFTGGDRMFFDRKNITGINCAPTARLMFNTNNRPRFNDKSGGIWRRLLLIPWDVTITPSERVLGMDKVEWWQTSGELPGMFLWAIRGLYRLRMQKQFSYSHRIEEGINSYRREVNPTREFLLEHVEECLGHKLRSEIIYRMYRKHTEAKGNAPMSDGQFGKEVKRCFPKSERKKGGSRNDRYWYYEGIHFSVDEIAGEKTDDATLF